MIQYGDNDHVKDQYTMIDLVNQLVDTIQTVHENHYEHAVVFLTMTMVLVFWSPAPQPHQPDQLEKLKFVPIDERLQRQIKQLS